MENEKSRTIAETPVLLESRERRVNQIQSIMRESRKWNPGLTQSPAVEPWYRRFYKPK